MGRKSVETVRTIVFGFSLETNRSCEKNRTIVRKEEDKLLKCKKRNCHTSAHFSKNAYLCKTEVFFLLLQE